MATFQCTVCTPRGVAFDGQVMSLVLPAADGELCILARHAPMLATLSFGELRIRRGGEGSGGDLQRFFVDGGFVQVLENRVSVLAPTAARLESLSAEEARGELEALLGSRPAGGASEEERSSYEERVEVARRKMRLAGS